MPEKSDLIIIGAGPAGYVGAIRASQLKAKVTLIEKNEVGGVCLNAGCIPTKVLTSTAHAFSISKRAGQFGLDAGDIFLNLSQLMRQKEFVVRGLVNGVKHLLRSSRINLIFGTAKFLDEKTIEVKRKDNEKEKVIGEKILVATGSSPIELSIPGAGQKNVMGSTQALNINQVPKHLLIIGAGTIGCEFASIYHAFGSKVSIVEILPQILPLEDEEISLHLRKLWEKEGIDIYTNSKVTEIKLLEQDEKLVKVLTPEKEIEIKADKVLVSVGRKANIEGLGIEKIDLRIENGNILVDETLRTNISNIYAVGDCIGGWLLAHLASVEAEVAVENALGANIKMDYTAVPRCTFTYPEISSVGLTEKDAKELGIKIKKGKFPFLANGKALAENEPFGFVKIIAEKDSGRIIGAHILGFRASDLIAELSLAIKLKAKTKDLIDTIHAHPTLSEAVREATLKLEGRPIHIL